MAEKKNLEIENPEVRMEVVKSLPEKAKRQGEENLIAQAAQLRSQKMKETTQRLTGLLTGEVVSGNPAVGYFVREVRRIRKEHSDVRAKIRSLESQLEALRRQELVLEGAHNKNLSDLEYMDKLATEEKDDDGTETE